MMFKLSMLRKNKKGYSTLEGATKFGLIAAAGVALGQAGQALIKDTTQSASNKAVAEMGAAGLAVSPKHMTFEQLNSTNSRTGTNAWNVDQDGYSDTKNETNANSGTDTYNFGN